MKDFVRDAWRIASACAAVAFVLSLLIGLIAANPFGIAISRAFLFAVLFAGLGTAVRAVVKAYLPEVMGAAPPPATAGTEGKAGSVDIVLPEDEDLQRQAFRRPAGSTAPPGGGSDGRGPSRSDAVSDEEATDVLEAPEDDEPSAAEARALGALAEELGQEAEPSEEREGESEGPGAGRRSPLPSTGEEEAEEAQAEELSRGVDSAELDALPDLAELEPPPQQQRNGPAPRAPRAAVGESPEDAVRNLLSNQDPATLARAIRTSLKKDEKG